MTAANGWSAAAPEVLKRHGSSFHWAGKLLAPDVRMRCARLYAICRTLDDLADGPATVAGQDAAEARLRELMTAIRERDTAEPLVAEADALFAEDDCAWAALKQLAAAAHYDVGPVRISDEAGLRSYAEGVAGTVGIMMASILGARPGSDTRAAARELGIAMQYTNIARDVLEDAGHERLYLPASWLEPAVTPAALVEGDPQARATAWQAVQRLLARAEDAYAIGWRGLPALPARSRLGIAVAGHVYRRIGIRMLALGSDQYWRGRCWTGRGEKLLASLYGISLFLRTSGRRRPSAPQGESNTLPPEGNGGQG